MILEPREGGRWFERGVDGTECDWGRVLTWEPEAGGVHLADRRRPAVGPDPAHAGEIEVRFHANRPEQTTVEVEHRHLERLVGGDGVYGAIEHGGGGWVALLAAFAEMVDSDVTFRSRLHEFSKSAAFVKESRCRPGQPGEDRSASGPRAAHHTWASRVKQTRAERLT